MELPPRTTVVAKAQAYDALPATKDPRIQKLAEQKIAVPAIGRTAELDRTKLVKQALEQLTQEKKANAIAARTIGRANERIDELQGKVVQLEELTATQRLEHHQAAYLAAGVTKDLKERLRLAEQLILDRNRVIVELEGNLAGARGELIVLRRAFDVQVDQLQQGRDQRNNLEQRLHALEGRIDTLQTELADARIKLQYQTELYEQTKICRRDCDLAGQHLAITLGGSVSIGGAACVLVSPYIGIPLLWGLEFFGLSRPNLAVATESSRASSERCAELRVLLGMPRYG